MNNMKYISYAISSQYLFSEDFKLPFGWKNCNEKFVNDAIDENELLRWDSSDKESKDMAEKDGVLPFAPPVMPVLISAPTGSGKNYFVVHGLRGYAKKRERSILFLSNHVALDAQMRRELGKITKVDTSFNDSVILEKYEEVFDNITVMTYQKLTQLLVSKDSDFFKKKFDYVVCDEAHFFVADALFNSDTGYLLNELIRRYFNSIRIYLSATFDEVLAPIYSYEFNYFKKILPSLKKGYYIFNNKEDYFIAMDKGKFAYNFSRDFSSYKPHFFDDLDEIEDAIVSDYLGKTKWLIFVNSRDEGKQLTMRLNSEFKKHCDGKIKELKKVCDSSTEIEIEVKRPYRDFAVFLDRYSRHKDDVSGEIWRKLINTGVLPCKILVATSVLDNGFSIKDDNVKNIVICTDDKIEFLQELGRRRILSEQDSVELYIRRVTPMSLNVRKSYLERQLDFYEIAYGGLQIPEDEKKKKYQIAEAFKKIWNRGDYDDFKYLSFTSKSADGLEVRANVLARWKIICLKREIERYEELVAQYGQEAASVIYKAEWIDLDPAKAVQISELGSAPMVDLIDFLEEYVSSESKLQLNDSSFERFSRDFQDLFHRAFPDEKINTGKNRDYWKTEAINNHLDKIDDKLNLSSKYVLSQIGEKCYCLEKR